MGAVATRTDLKAFRWWRKSVECVNVWLLFVYPGILLRLHLIGQSQFCHITAKAAAPNQNILIPRASGI